MKSFSSILTIALLSIIIISSACRHSKTYNQSAFKNPDESKLKFKAIFKGGYSNFADTTDRKLYFLVEVNLINNTNSICEFVTMSCASFISIVTDSKQIDFLYHNCSANYPTIIKLKPKQEFSIPIILYRKRTPEKFNPEIKFGFVLVNPNSIRKDPLDVLFQMNKEQKNVIWSEPISLNSVSFHPYKILEKLDDSAFIEIDYYGISKRTKK